MAFIGGVAALGIISIGAGFAKDKIAIIVLQLLVAAAMTIPSALSLLVNVFVEPNEQARAIGVFGGCGAVGNGEWAFTSKWKAHANRRRYPSARPDYWCHIRPICILVVGLLVRGHGCIPHRYYLLPSRATARGGCPRRGC